MFVYVCVSRVKGYSPLLRDTLKRKKKLKDLLEKLQNIGISKREAEIYIALLQKNEFTAPELAKITTITRTKIYEILQNLIRKGICNESYRDGQKIFRGVKPQIAIQNIVSNYELEIEQKKQAAILLEVELAAIYKNNLHNDNPLNYIEVLSDIGQVKDRWLSIQKNAKKELIGFSKPPYAQIKLEANIEAEAEVIKTKKIMYKSIYEYAGLTSEERNKLIELIVTYQKTGEQARIIKELPMKLLICDEKITMLALNDTVSLKPSITTMIVNHPSFAVALKNVFESYWANAISIEEFKKL